MINNLTFVVPFSLQFRRQTSTYCSNRFVNMLIAVEGFTCTKTQEFLLTPNPCSIVIIYNTIF